MRQVTRTASRLPQGGSARVVCALAAATALTACLLPNVAQSADKAPPKTAHACVNIEGHTAPVRAIGFTPDSEYLCTAGMDKVVHVWKLPQPGGGEGAAEGAGHGDGKRACQRAWLDRRGPRGWKTSVSTSLARPSGCTC